MNLRKANEFTGCKFFLFLTLLIGLSLLSCKKEKILLREVAPSHSGILFENTITESDSVNQLDNGNVYNGGGVGIGDFNNDGLPDIYFTGNLVSCRLYLNRGDFKFDDITGEASVGGDGKWCRGVAVTDINNDGWQDIYVSATISSSPEKRKNLLYINLGLNKNGIPTFNESAALYGLDDDSHTTQAAFFDYDNDGDIDVYLVINEINDRDSPYLFKPPSSPGPGPGRGKLFRNDYDTLLKHPRFTDVTMESGIGIEGFGNQASILDINEDGWKDIYVSNDYLTSDLLWINNHDGTFSEKLSEYFRHTSNSAMGNDVGDINNDGLMEIVTLDMNPEDNFRKKMMLLPSSYQFYQNSERYGYNFQYTRNTLQLNQGRRVTENTKSGDPVFSEISYYAGMEATDWSWCALFADFDNDSYNDLFIANGFPRDITDRDFGMYRSNAWLSTPKMEVLKQVPEVKIHNYVYRNNGDLRFTDMSQKWGLSAATFSNGAAVADFDRDGDPDLVVNNINDKASLYRNMSRELYPGSSNYLQIKFIGDSLNLSGLGAYSEIYYGNGKMQIRENAPFRGYLSTSENIAHFGLGKIDKIDSVIIRWQSGKRQIIQNVIPDQVLAVRESEADEVLFFEKNETILPLFTDVTSESGIKYVHREEDFVDFNIQKLIPHKFSEFGPALAAGDINGDGLDDLVSGGSANNSAQIFLQKTDGTFIQKALLNGNDLKNKSWDDTGILLFDAEGDGDNDLYIASGGYENEHNIRAFSDHFYINDGRGNFSDRSDLIPQNLTSKGCVRSADIDHDGDADIFISGRVRPWSYPLPVSSFIYRNDSEKGKVLFTDVTGSLAADLINIGMVEDALFTDYDNDGWTDLVLACEWLPFTLLRNEKGIFHNVTPGTGIEKFTGWWNSISEGDFDNDGDRDFVLGNLGLNSYYRASLKRPVTVCGRDFDNNGSFDAFLSLYILSSQSDTTFREFPSHGRDDLIKQMLPMRAKFPTFRSLASSTFDRIFTPEQLKDAVTLKASEFRSSLIRNDGNGKFTLVPLPGQAQLSALNGMIADDFDGDGKTDLLVNTNDYGTEVLTGRYDALSGLVMMGKGNGEFTPLTITESGIYIPGNGRALVKFTNHRGDYLVAASQNRGELKIFRKNIKNTLR